MVLPIWCQNEHKDFFRDRLFQRVFWIFLLPLYHLRSIALYYPSLNTPLLKSVTELTTNLCEYD